MITGLRASRSLPPRGRRRHRRSRRRLPSPDTRYIVGLPSPGLGETRGSEDVVAAGNEMRVSDAEREAAAAELREHFTSGRLDQEELDQRLTAVFAAKTRGDLSALFTDLPPREHGPASPGGAGSAAGTSLGPGSFAAGVVRAEAVRGAVRRRAVWRGPVPAGGTRPRGGLEPRQRFPRRRRGLAGAAAYSGPRPGARSAVSRWPASRSGCCSSSACSAFSASGPGRPLGDRLPHRRVRAAAAAGLHHLRTAPDGRLRPAWPPPLAPVCPCQRAFAGGGATRGPV